MLRCKRGDLAIVVNLTVDQSGYEYLGTFLTCGPYETSPNSGEWTWRIENPSQPLLIDGGPQVYTHVPDYCLQPIKGVAPQQDIEKDKEALLPV